MTTSDMTITDLFQIVRECAGVEDGVTLDGDALDHSFVELGYDSVAMLEVAGRIERARGVKLDDDAVGGAETPRLFLNLVNGSVPARV